ncbi:MAG: hypothetical protein K6F82_01555 [Sphaerochaetaceae bacterium]|nr:hypothetical protein [Sphaerochaetaceae bacterium]
MFEKVNPNHPDKVADRIAGAVVDLAYSKTKDPKIAVEVLLGHGTCTIISETSVSIKEKEVADVVKRITGCSLKLKYIEVPQDVILSGNQDKEFRCGDNGIFKGTVVTDEQKKLSKLAKDIYRAFPTDGKYIIDSDKVVICQSHAKEEELRKFCPTAIINPLGEWTGGPDVDCGATNRKLGSDMGDSVTGGGLHGKDLSKADVSVNIYAWLEAQKTGKTVQFSCAIGDTEINGVPFSEIVETARAFIDKAGGFENFAMWGLV